MPIYKGTTELTKIADFLTATEHNIAEVYFGDKQVFSVWGEYDGTLPATYSANGSMLADYRVYGSDGGVGDDRGTAYGYSVPMSVGSGNLFDPSDTTPNYRYDDNGNWVNNAGVLSSGYIKVAAGYKYKYKFITVNGKNAGICRINFLDASGQWLSVNKVSFTVAVGATVTVSGTVPAGTAFIRTSQYNGEQNISMIVVADTTPIYIGDEPLGEDEYVDYATRKIYRRTENIWNGVYEQGGLDFTTGSTFESANYVHTGRMRCGGMTDIAFTYFAEAEQAAIVFYDGNGDYIREGSTMMISGGDPTFEYNDSVPSGAVYVAISFSAATSSQPISPETAAQVMVIEGSTIPSTYIPYLQPTDPPVPLPTLPTVDGVNVVDYAGQSVVVPSRFYAKYRKEGY